MAGVVTECLKAELDKREVELLKADEYGYQLLEEKGELLNELWSVKRGCVAAEEVRVI